MESDVLSAARLWAQAKPAGVVEISGDASSLVLIPRKAGAAGLEFLLETDTLFTVSLAGESVELELTPSSVVALCESVYLGICRHTRWWSGSSVIAVKTEIGEPRTRLSYVRKLLGYSVEGPGLEQRYQPWSGTE